jgi:hypothetical protein
VTKGVSNVTGCWRSASARCDKKSENKDLITFWSVVSERSGRSGGLVSGSRATAILANTVWQAANGEAVAASLVKIKV